MASAFAGAAAQAQTPSCEQFKAELTARIARGAGSFRVEALPSGAAVPAGGRVVGNCGGGQWKLVMLAGAAAPASPASAPVRETRASRTAAAQPTAASAPELPPARPIPAPVPAPAPAPAPAPVSLPAPAPPPADVPASAASSPWTAPASRLPLWIAGAVLALVAIAAWRWIAHRLHYDAAGLPRGPRLR